MKPYETVHLKKIYKGLAECTVLLKKDGGFPLGEAGKIAAYGGGVRHTVKGGTGSGEMNSRYFITVEQGLKDAGFEVTSTFWLDAYDDILQKSHEQFVKDIKAKAKEEHTNAVLVGMGAVMSQPEYKLPLEANGDSCIYVLSRVSGEGNDRAAIPGDFLLSATEIRDILALNEKFEKFMLVLNTGGPIDLTPVQNVKNILLLSQLGVETGRVLADILLGKEYPSGKLTATWAAAKEYPDVGSFGERDDSLYKEGIYVGYRWFDAVGKEPLYPFGYGLGYTEFAVLDVSTSLSENTVSVRAVVKNIGNFPGKETVQVYVSCPWGKLDKPVKDLAAFVKTKELAPNEKDIVTTTFDLTDLASYDEENASYILEGGMYTILVGNSSVNAGACAAINLDFTVTVKKVRNAFGKVDFADWKPQNSLRITDGVEFSGSIINVPIINVFAKNFGQETVNYISGESIDKQIEDLGDEELCSLNMGAFDAKGGFGERDRLSVHLRGRSCRRNDTRGCRYPDCDYG